MNLKAKVNHHQNFISEIVRNEIGHYQKSAFGRKKIKCTNNINTKEDCCNPLKKCKCKTQSDRFMEYNCDDNHDMDRNTEFSHKLLDCDEDVLSDSSSDCDNSFKEINVAKRKFNSEECNDFVKMLSELNDHESELLFKSLNSIVYSPKEEEYEHILTRCHAFLHLLWQKIHTGHWKSVKIEIRLAFSWGSVAVVWLLLHRLRACASTCSAASCALRIVRVCDRALLMGQPLAQQPLKAVAAALHETALAAITEITAATTTCIKPSSPLDSWVPPEVQHLSSCVSAVEVSSLPALDRFLLNYMHPRKPLLMKGLTRHWPANERWSPAFLVAEAGARTVPVEIGRRYSDSAWAQRLMPLGVFVHRYMSTQAELNKCEDWKQERPPVAYLAQHDLLDQVPQLRADVLVPDYCHLGESSSPPALNAWIGPEGTVTPAHHDPDHNIFAQVYGYKLVLLFDECESDKLYPFDGELLNNTSQVNLDDVLRGEDVRVKWPLLDNIRGHYAVLGPGDGLYIPPKMWHYVRSLSHSMSVSFWWK